MTDTDLARRATACKGWRWLPGMGCINPAMPDAWCSRIGDECRPTYNHYLPDLTDPATLGCLLALVREARGDSTYLPTVIGRVSGARWAVEHTMPYAQTWHPSEAAALVAALEAAPACDYHGALSGCHSLYCPVHGQEQSL